MTSADAMPVLGLRNAFNEMVENDVISGGGADFFSDSHTV